MEISKIMNKYIFSNPFNYKYFSGVLICLIMMIVVGMIIVLLFNIRNFKSMHKSITFKKLVGWMVMAPTFLLTVMSGGVIALALISFIVVKCLNEFIKIFHLPRFYFFSLLGIWFGSVLIFILVNLFGDTLFQEKFILTLPIIYLLIISLISVLRGRLEDVMKRVSYSYFASIWICFSMLHFILLSKESIGKELLIMIGVSVALSDVFAFIIGKLFVKIGFGVRHKIAENISPNKTYAGIIGNVVGASIGILSLTFLLPDFSLLNFLMLIIIISISSSFGDMLESLVKRAANIKDTSAAIFGHGGFLDRIDSFLIVIVIVYYYLFFFTEVLK